MKIGPPQDELEKLFDELGELHELRAGAQKKVLANDIKQAMKTKKINPDRTDQPAARHRRPHPRAEMNSNMRETVPSAVEVSNVAPDGFGLLLDSREIFVPFQPSHGFETPRSERSRPSRNRARITFGGRIWTSTSQSTPSSTRSAFRWSARCR